jgi:hypothetical protein
MRYKNALKIRMGSAKIKTLECFLKSKLLKVFQWPVQ